MKKYKLQAIALAQDYPTDIINTPGKVVLLFQTVSNWIYTIFIVVAVIGFIFTAFMYLTAGGDQTKATKARQALNYSIVAIIVAVLAGSMPLLLRNILESAT